MSRSPSFFLIILYQNPKLENFSAFYHGWLAHHETLLHQLLDLTDLTDLTNLTEVSPLIERVLSHYQQYYEQQTRAAGEDIFQVLSTPWLTSYERALLWISGFKPSFLFRLLDGAVEGVSETQAHRLQRVKAETKRRERELSEAMASLQETVAAPPIQGVVRRAGREMDGEISEMDSVMEDLQMAMQRVLERADRVRGITMKKVMEILTPPQMVKLLAAAAEYHLRIRRWGVEIDSHRITTLESM